LKILTCNNNKIMKIPELPPFLATFNCSKNPLKEYPILPPSIVNYTM
jgi:Leucine-rich repeat (LRR) protein